jgi:hypothetical protein
MGILTPKRNENKTKFMVRFGKDRKWQRGSFDFLRLRAQSLKNKRNRSILPGSPVGEFIEFFRLNQLLGILYSTTELFKNKTFHHRIFYRVQIIFVKVMKNF